MGTGSSSASKADMRDSARLRRSSRPLLEPLEPRLLLSADWTVMVYIAGDNNLEGAGVDDVNEMEVVGSTAEVNIAVQFDRTSWYDDSNGDWEDTRRGLIIQDDDTDIISSDLTSIGEVNMGSAASLSQFIDWATTDYPADRYALVLWDHGGGIDGVAWDDTSAGDYLTVKEVRMALSQSGVHLDVIAFDACLMSMLEVAYEIADHGDVMIGSEELVPFDGYPYDTSLADLVASPQWSAAELADAMVTRYGEFYPGQDVTLSAVDLAAVPTMAGAVSGLADAFLTERADLDVAENARNASDYFDWEDFYDLGTYLAEVAINATNANIAAVATDALNTYDTTVLSNFTGGILNGTGLSIYFPGPGQGVSTGYAVGSYAFVADTSWRDFLEVFADPRPEITVAEGATVINDGQTVPVDFGSVQALAPYVVKTFTVSNDGDADLVLQQITVPDGFELNVFSWGPVAPGTGVSFTVSLVTEVPGSFSGDVTIITNDFDEGTFNFPIAGDVLASGEITVLYGGSAITDGDSTPIDFGTFDVNDPTVEHVFTVQNDGGDNLSLGTITAPSGYILTQPAETLLAPGASTTFTLQLNSAVMGVHAGQVTLVNSDQDESPFNFALTGTVNGPDLIVNGVNYAPGRYAIGRDSIALNTRLSNVGTSSVSDYQRVQIEARLSTDMVWGNQDDVVVYQRQHNLPDLAVGQDSPAYLQILLTSFGMGQAGVRYLGVRVNSDGGLNEMDLENDTWWSSEANVELYRGDYYTRLVTGSKVVFQDDAGNSVRVAFSGPGYADIRTTNGLTDRRMGGDIREIILGGTTGKSQLKIAVSGGTTNVGDVVVRGSLKAFQAKGVSLSGDMAVLGTVGKIVLGDVAGDHALTIGAPDSGDPKADVDLTFGRVAELDITTQTPIGSLTVTDWLDQGGTPDLIQASWIGKLTTKGNRRAGVAGDFEAGLLLDGDAAPKATLWSAKIAGDLREAVWDITGDLDKMSVRGKVVDSTIRATGSMSKITVGAADGADFLAGMKDTVVRHAADGTDFDDPLATIASFKITGVRDGATRWYFEDSNLSAAMIGKVDLLNIKFDNSGTNFGVYARDAGTGSEIQSVKYADKVTGAKWSYPWKVGQFVNTEDMDIDIL